MSGVIDNTLNKIIEMGGNTKKLDVCIGPCIAQESYEVKNDFYSKFNEESMENDSFFLKKENDSFNFDLRGFVIKKFNSYGVYKIGNINIDSFANKKEYFSHRRAKKLGENDYGRCISVIKKTNLQN